MSLTFRQGLVQSSLLDLRTVLDILYSMVGVMVIMDTMFGCLKNYLVFTTWSSFSSLWPLPIDSSNISNSYYLNTSLGNPFNSGNSGSIEPINPELNGLDPHSSQFLSHVEPCNLSSNIGPLLSIKEAMLSRTVVPDVPLVSKPEQGDGGGGVVLDTTAYLAISLVLFLCRTMVT